jgi:cobalt-zinc-cadmium resistance protein CzcA
VVRDAALEVRKPTMFGELIIMIVYLPILALEGIEGKLFRPMALTVIFALLGSMLLSLTADAGAGSLAAAAHGPRPSRLVGPGSSAPTGPARAALRAPAAGARVA